MVSGLDLDVTMPEGEFPYGDLVSPTKRRNKQRRENFIPSRSNDEDYRLVAPPTCCGTEY